MKAFKREGEQDMKDESRIVRVETVIENLQYILEKMDKRFDKIEIDLKDMQRGISNKFDQINDRFHDLHKESKVHFRWMMAFGVAILGSPLVVSLINYFHSVKI